MEFEIGLVLFYSLVIGVICPIAVISVCYAISDKLPSIIVKENENIANTLIYTGYFILIVGIIYVTWF